jgi:hypothetical protein
MENPPVSGSDSDPDAVAILPHAGQPPRRGHRHFANAQTRAAATVQDVEVDFNISDGL